MVLYFRICDVTASKIVFTNGMSSWVGGFTPAFHSTSAQQDTVVEICLPSRYCIKYSLISQRESQRALLQLSGVSSVIQTCIEATLLECTDS